MANPFEPAEQTSSKFNSGNKYVNGNSLPAETINGLIEGLLYAQTNKASKTTVDNLTNTVSQKANLTAVNNLSARVTTLENNKLPTVSTNDNGKILQVASGKWTAQTLPIYNGETGDV